MSIYSQTLKLEEKINFKININLYLIVFYLKKSIKGNLVTFENNESAEYDQIILCTGYKMGLEFLSSDLKTKIFSDKEEANLNVRSFKN